MKTRIQKFQEILSKCEVAYKENPMLFPFDSIIQQINYLIRLELGQTDDVLELKKIKIGWIAVRELDGYEDQELINELCSVSKEAEVMLQERGVK